MVYFTPITFVSSSSYLSLLTFKHQIWRGFVEKGLGLIWIFALKNFILQSFDQNCFIVVKIAIQSIILELFQYLKSFHHTVSSVVLL